MDTYRAKEGLTLKSADVWEVKSPPPTNTIKGHFVPKALTTSRRRRISIEVYSNNNSEKENSEEVFVRFLDQTVSSKWNNLKSIDDVSEYTGSEIGSVVDGWTQKYKFPVNHITVDKRVGCACAITTKRKNKAQTRDIIFNSEEEAIAFCDKIGIHKKLKTAVLTAMAALGLSKSRAINILVEIVSAVDLPIGDLKSSDPYVVIMFNDEAVHKTKYIPTTLKPIWTVKTNSLFLLKTTTKHLFHSPDGMVCFEVRDFDRIGKDTLLGISNVPASVIYKSKGERLEYPVKKQRPDGTERSKGTLVLRFRHATEHDISFMDKLAKGEVKVQKTHKTLNGIKLKNSFLKNKKTDGSGVVRYRARPGPDPKREETEWITKELIDLELLNDSKKWIDIGSGNLARVFLEVLGCDKLPNMDTKLGGKTDSIVSVTYEDSVIETDRIDDCLSPRWLPWTQRAFIFHMSHPSSPLFLGIFDYDETGDNDFIGRVAVDLANFIPRTEYILTYNIKTLAAVEEEFQGTITIRLRIECHDERQLLKQYLSLPHNMHVNVQTKKEFSIVKAQVHGKHDYEAYSIPNIYSHLMELATLYQLSYVYTKRALVNVLLWRGTFPLKFPGSRSPSIYLPINSIFLFASSATVVEKPSLLPTYFFGCLTLIMFATMNFVQSNPSPWSKRKSFYDILLSLTGKSFRAPERITANQNKEESENFETYWRNKIQETEHDSQLRYEENLEMYKEQMIYNDEIEKLDDDIATKNKGLSIDPFKPYIYPLQIYLFWICKSLRVLRYILLWNEPYYAFLVTAASIVLCVSCYFIPWAWMLIWFGRIIIWMIFGPWMKLVDIYYYKDIEHLTSAERAARRQEVYDSTKKYLKQQLSLSRMKKENAEKLKAMKTLLFGKFIIRVPTLKVDAYQDFPLSSSYAIPYQRKAKTLAEISMEEGGQNRIHLPGHQLVGDMIPVPLKYSFTDASIGQPVGCTEDSNLSSYVKIAAVLVAAFGFTLFGVPQIINLIQFLQTPIYRYVTNILQMNTREYLNLIDTLSD